jgi:hypothetical protein
MALSPPLFIQSLYTTVNSRAQVRLSVAGWCSEDYPLNLGNVSVSLPDHPLLILLALEEEIRPLLLKGDKLLHAQEEADHVRITLEHFFLEFVTHIYRGQPAESTTDLVEK